VEPKPNPKWAKMKINKQTKKDKSQQNKVKKVKLMEKKQKKGGGRVFEAI
jgi:hypothetical protein